MSSNQVTEQQDGRYLCHACGTTLAKVSLKKHFETAKHKNNVARKQEPAAIKKAEINIVSGIKITQNKPGGYPREPDDPNVTEQQNGRYLCHSCGTTLAKASLKKHFETKKHKDNVARKQGPEAMKKADVNIASGIKITQSETAGRGATVIQMQVSQNQQVTEQANQQTPSEQRPKCQVCDKDYASEQTLKRHYETKLHKANVLKKQEKAKGGNTKTHLALVRTDQEGRSVALGKPPQEVNEGQVGSAWCDVCECQLASQSTYKAHLTTKKHRDNLLKREERNGDAAEQNPQEALSLPLTVNIQAQAAALTNNSDDDSSDDDENKDNQACPTGLTDNDSRPYVCMLCNKDFTRKATLQEHFKSEVHISREKESVRQRQPISQRNREVYDVSSSPRGVVHVFNYMFSGQETQWERVGAEVDWKNIKKTFSKMGYDVRLHESLNKIDTVTMLEKIRDSESLQRVDSLIFFFLSHGKDAYNFHANDMGEINLFQVRSNFTDGKCSYMEGKPKIFFMNYCRGKNLELKDTDLPPMETPDDMVTIHAAAEGTAAWRSAKKGTFFVASLCKMINRFGRSSDLRQIYHNVRDDMKDNQYTKPMWEDYGFRTFYFNPV